MNNLTVEEKLNLTHAEIAKLESTIAALKPKIRDIDVSVLNLTVYHKNFGKGTICKEYINPVNNDKFVDIVFPARTVTFLLDTLPNYAELEENSYFNLLTEQKQLVADLKRAENQLRAEYKNLEIFQTEVLEKNYNVFCFGDDFDNEFFDLEYPASITIDDIKFSSVGNYLIFKSSENDIYFCDGPRMRNKNKIREIRRKLDSLDDRFWKHIREELAFRALLAKFDKSPKYKKQLLATEDKLLVYCSKNDLVWGAGVSTTDGNRFIPELWKGQNLLGKILQDVRDFLRKNISSQDITFTIFADEYGCPQEWYYFTSPWFEDNSLCARWDIESQFSQFESDFNRFRDEYREQFDILKQDMKNFDPDYKLSSYERFKYRVKRMSELGIPLK